MTREQAEAKAAALTAAGRLARVYRDSSKPGGFRTRDVAKNRARNWRYATSVKGRAVQRLAEARYANSPKGALRRALSAIEYVANKRGNR